MNGDPPVLGDPAVAALLGGAGLEQVPLAALQAGLQLPLHDFLGLRLTGLHPATLELPLGEAARTAMAPLHGGVVATLIDVVGNVAIATSGRVDAFSYSLVTTELQVRLRRQPTGSRVIATGTALADGRRRMYADCEVTDDTGACLATGRVTTLAVPRRSAGGTAEPPVAAAAAASPAAAPDPAGEPT